MKINVQNQNNDQHARLNPHSPALWQARITPKSNELKFTTNDMITLF